MENFTLNAKPRDLKIKAKTLRKNKLVPAVIYGHKVKPQNLTLDQKEFNHIYDLAGRSSLVDLKIADSSIRKALIHIVDYHPVADNIIHVDFYQVKMDEEITADIPIKIIGEAPAVEEQGGSLITNRSLIEVRCLPGDLIRDIEVDISRLDNFEKTITVADLKLPNNIEILSDPEEVIVLIQPPRSEEELKELEEEVKEDVETVKVEEKGKLDEGEATVQEPDQPEVKKQNDGND